MVHDAGPSPRGRILIVDDEPSIRFLLRRILERGGHEVLEAEHGASALRCLAAELPDLVVTDLMMPVMEGAELIQRLRSDPQTAELPIVVVSENPQAGHAGGHADAHLGKPFHPAELLSVVAALLRERQIA